jgi:hypothetical protein
MYQSNLAWAIALSLLVNVILVVGSAVMFVNCKWCKSCKNIDTRLSLIDSKIANPMPTNPRILSPPVAIPRNVSQTPLLMNAMPPAAPSPAYVPHSTLPVDVEVRSDLSRSPMAFHFGGTNRGV